MNAKIAALELQQELIDEYDFRVKIIHDPAMSCFRLAVPTQGITVEITEAVASGPDCIRYTVIGTFGRIDTYNIKLVLRLIKARIGGLGILDCDEITERLV